MNSIEDVLVPLQKSLSMASGVPLDRVILGNQGHGAPAGNAPYISYLPTPLRAYGRPSETVKDSVPVEEYDASLGGDWKDFKQTLSTNWIILVSVTVFNEGADTIITRLPYAHMRNDVLSITHSSGISWRNASNVRNLSGVMQAGIQPRYNIDIEIWAKLDVTLDILRAARIPFTIRDADDRKILVEG